MSHCIEVRVIGRTSAETTCTPFLDPIEARAAAFAARAAGRLVIIRPSFNEPHLGTLAYREWHSHDGGLWDEIHFLPDPMEAHYRGGGRFRRLDAEVILPPIPES